ncbi:uncharacterized protein LOC144344216 [Saccoglossus kowalevskii]
MDVFSTMIESMGYLMTVSVGSHRYFGFIMRALGVSGKLFILLFASFSILATINIFVASITSAFKYARAQNRHQENGFEMIQYMKSCLEDALYMHLNIDISRSHGSKGKYKHNEHIDGFRDRVGDLLDEIEGKVDKISYLVDGIGY